MDTPSYKFPTKKETDPEVLYASLGSFWTQLFQEKGTIKGYTLGQSEELVQSYYNLIETINSYSADQVSVFHKEKWHAITIKKSEFNRVTLRFEQNEAVYGAQPADDVYYAAQVFKLGFPKNSNLELFTYKLSADFNSCSVLANKVLNPSVIYINGTDFYIKNGIAFLNKNLFEQKDIIKYDLIDDDGSQVYFTDTNNKVIKDQVVVLWAYHAGIDKQALYDSFGYIFNLKLKNDQLYKDILSSLVKFYNNGATVAAIKNIAASLLGAKSVVQEEEVIEDIFEETNVDGSIKFKHVTTDKTAYKFDPYYNILAHLAPGYKVYAGEQLVDAFEYYDHVQQPYWWKNKLSPKVSYNNSNLAFGYPGMHFPSFIFLGNYEGHLYFDNTLALMTYDYTGNLKFPIVGSKHDIDEFNSQLNTRRIAGKLVKESITEKLNLKPGDTYPLYPLDFLFDNFIKSNTAALKVNFKNSNDTKLFMDLFPTLKELLPKHVYLIVYIDFPIQQDVYNSLNNAFLISDRKANADGSDDLTLDSFGIINEVGSVGKHNNPIETKLFTFGHAINLGGSLHVRVGAAGTAPSDTLHYMEGQLSTFIPDEATTAEITRIDILNFCTNGETGTSDPITTTSTTPTTTTTTPTTTTTTPTTTTTTPTTTTTTPTTTTTTPTTTTTTPTSTTTTTPTTTTPTTTTTTTPTTTTTTTTTAAAPTVFTVTNSGFSAYVINGASNPTLNLTKGSTYTFNISAVGHPFWIKTTRTTGQLNAYSTGITNNGTANGALTFTVDAGAPSTLFYNCEFHSSLSGIINIT